MSDTPPIIVHRRGEDYAKPMLFWCFWDHSGMLQIRQNQKHSEHRIGSDEEPALVQIAEAAKVKAKGGWKARWRAQQAAQTALHDNVIAFQPASPAGAGTQAARSTRHAS